jgi:amino acid adenylation domain-containing protein
MIEGTVSLPPSYAQELMWLTERASSGSSAYNIPRTRRLSGVLDIDALRRTFDAIVARHEILRTTYAFDAERAVQVIHPGAAAAFEVVDLTHLPAIARDAEAARQVRERSSRPFDLSFEAPFRVAVLRLGPTEHLLHIDSHHIAADGWSRDVMFRDLDALYTAFAAGVEPALPVLPIQYADYSVWQREQMSGDRLEQLLAYWRDQLGDAEFVLDVPTDFPRPPVAATDGVMRSIDLSPTLVAGIRQLGRRHDATVYMTLLAAYATLLHRYTGRTDVLVGSPIAGRSVAETEGLIGYFANTIVQRARFASDPTFDELVAQVRESALGAYEHQDIPFEKLVLELQGGQSLDHSPLFQVVFTMLEAAQGTGARLGNLEMQPVAGEGGTTKFDLTLFMAERADRLTLSLRGRSDLFAPATIERMLQHLQLVLEGVVADPGRQVSALSLSTADETATLARVNGTAADVGVTTSITAVLEAAFDLDPAATAVVAGDVSITYAELERRSNQLAHHLRRLKVGAGTPVALCLDRSADAIVALVATLKAGGCYVPLAPELPPARLAQQRAECGAPVVITHAVHLAKMPTDVIAVCLDRDAAAIESEPVDRLAVTTAPGALAYVLFTSGSTGVPKGVAVTHANIVHYVRAVSRVLAEVPAGETGDGLGALRHWSFGLASALAADLGNTALFPALCAGGTLHVLTDAVVTDAGRYAEYLAKHPIDVLKLTPNHLRALLADRSVGELAAALPQRWLVLGGEALHWDLAERLLAGGRCKVLNHYGPTETTVGASTFRLGSRGEVPLAATVPIGKPLANVQMHVLDAHRQPAPTGVPGELYIGGAGVAQGYLNRPEMTAERFMDLAGIGRVYRTGDRVRRLESGYVEFLGRMDNQVKIRGFRVELGEIEQVLGQFAGVAQCAVILRDDGGASEPALVAYVVARTTGYAAAHADRPSAERLQQWVADLLPGYMVPASVVLLERLPLTRNGKLDREALPAPGAQSSATTSVPPRTQTEIVLVQIWADALKREPSTIGITDDFLSLGGHSLVAIRILGKISRTFGLRLPLRTLFDAPQIDQLAELVDLERKLAALDSVANETAGT